MGTRGALGFWKNGEHKITYNHFDSYLDGLGNDILNFIHKHTIEEMNNIFNTIKLVTKDDTPTKEQIEKCTEFLDLNVSNQNENDWYCLLRNAQGNLEAYFKAGYMIDNQNFLYDSVFCEYAYIINLTDNILEVYEGFQTSKPEGRYTNGKSNDQGYYAVGLIAVYPLGNCPTKFSLETTPELFKDEEE